MHDSAARDILSPLADHVPRLLDGSSWRASVALVLRWRSHPPPPLPAAAAPSPDYLDRHADRLELLYIRRATREGDPWSGDLAFPGGRRDPDDSSDLACAVREAREEVALDLADATQFRLCGRLDDVRVPVRRGGIMSAFVFLQLRPGAECVPAADEVAVALWAPVSCLLHGSPARTVHVFSVEPRHLGMLGAVLPLRARHFLGLTRIRYTAVDIISAATQVIIPDASLHTLTRGAGAGDEATRNSDSEPELRRPVLWGLSMTASSSMISIIGGRNHFSAEPVFVFDSKPVAAFMRLLHAPPMPFSILARMWRSIRPWQDPGPQPIAAYASR
jgi:8-oxo-dGTP pyrophosphatase MutT (NUDIX family)